MSTTIPKAVENGSLDTNVAWDRAAGSHLPAAEMAVTEGQNTVLTTTATHPEQQVRGQAMIETTVLAPPLPSLASSVWDKNLAALKAFKHKNGHTNVPADNADLGAWVFFQKQQYRNMMGGQAHSLTADQAEQLHQLGFGIDELLPRANNKVKPSATKPAKVNKSTESRGRSKDEETWNARLQQLKMFHAHSGHFRVPVSEKRGTKRPRASTANEVLDAETIKLGKWVKRQRRCFATDQLSPDRIAALTEIGFDFKPGNATKSERLEIQLGLLDSLRQRRELSNAQVADLNFLYDEWKRRGDEDKAAKPVHVKRSSDGCGKFDLRWREKFEELQQFKLDNGHTRVPQMAKCKDGDESEADKAQRALAKWVDYQRQCYWKIKKGQKAALTPDRISQLENIGFEWRIRIKMPLPGEGEETFEDMGGLGADGLEASTAANSTDVHVDDTSRAAYEFVFAAPLARDEEHENMNDYKWNCRYQELFRYRQQFGTTRVVYSLKSQDEHFQELSALSKWADMQRNLFQKRKKGESNGLTKERIKRLEEIGFDFTSTSGKAVDFRGWNAKLQRLKEFKAKFGHTRVPARKKKHPNDPHHDPELQSLAKWCEHQRGMYWKRARGEKNALSDERIASLEEVGFEWRLVHTVGRPSVEGLKTAEVDPVADVEANHMSADALADTIDAIDSIPAIPTMGPPTYSI